MERLLATLATTSRESLVNVAADQRRTSFDSSDLAAATVPRPNTRSLIPMVRRSRIDAPVGGSRRDKRKNGPGTAINNAPTPARSQPILSTAAAAMGRSVSGASPLDTGVEKSAP